MHKYDTIRYTYENQNKIYNICPDVPVLPLVHLYEWVGPEFWVGRGVRTDKVLLGKKCRNCFDKWTWIPLTEVSESALCTNLIIVIVIQMKQDLLPTSLVLFSEFSYNAFGAV